jgi:predicted component of viral defense system (DUF524 family)
MDEVEFDGGRGRLWTTTDNRLLILGDDEPLLAPARYALYEWTDYWLRFDGARLLRVGDTLTQPIDGSLFPVRFGNQLGLTRIHPIGERGPLCAPLLVEVLSPKFPTLDAHVGFLRALLDDLFARAARLPFAISAETVRGVIESPSPPTPLFTLHFLLQYHAELRQAVGIVQAQPHRRLADHPAIVPVAEASEIDADVLLDALRTPERWARAHGTRLGERMGGYAPAAVWQRRPEESLDTPENRFVLAFLRALLAAADRLPSQPFWRHVSPAQQRIVRETATLLRLAIEYPLFAEVGQLQRIPTSSRVLLRREGYRQLLHLWRLFHLARRPLFGALHQAIDLRDVATLYEVWAFFALVEEIQAALNVTPTLRLRVSDEHGLDWRSVADFGSAGRLVYNQSRKGYSVGLRPDFLWVRNERAEVALDAKFRLDRPDWSDDEGRATVKNDDLYKMLARSPAIPCRFRSEIQTMLRSSQRRWLEVLTISSPVTTTCWGWPVNPIWERFRW